MLQIEIQDRINAMNGLVFDLSDSDLEDIQEVIETNSDDDTDHDETSTFVKAADVSLQPPIHKPDSAMNADAPVGSSDAALITDSAQKSSGADNMSNADIGLSVQNEHNHEVQSILRQLKDHIPDKYIVTYDEVSHSKSLPFLFFSILTIFYYRNRIDSILVVSIST